MNIPESQFEQKPIYMALKFTGDFQVCSLFTLLLTLYKTASLNVSIQILYIEICYIY